MELNADFLLRLGPVTEEVAGLTVISLIKVGAFSRSSPQDVAPAGLLLAGWQESLPDSQPRLQSWPAQSLFAQQGEPPAIGNVRSSYPGGIKQDCFFAGLRVSCCLARGLPKRTGNTGQGEIIQGSLSTSDYRDDMVYVECRFLSFLG